MTALILIPLIYHPIFSPMAAQWKRWGWKSRNDYCHLEVLPLLSLHMSPLRTKSFSASLQKESWTQAVLTA